MNTAARQLRVFVEPQPAVALVAVGLVVLQAAAGVGFALVHGFDFSRTTDVASLVERGPGTADAFRWALLVDMLAYLAVAPVVLFLYGRLEAIAEGSERLGWLTRMGTIAGLIFSVSGAIGAAFLASVGPPLIQAAAAGGAGATAAQVTFSALASGIYVGLWGPLDFLVIGIWVGVVGWFARGEGRPFAVMSTVVALGTVGYAARIAITGRTPTEILEPIDLVVSGALGLLIVWEAWLAARLWSGR